MSRPHFFPQIAAASVVFLCSSLIAENAMPPRIVDRIDDSQLVTLKGNTYPAARAANDRGRVSPDLPMTDLVLVLKRSPEQQAAFDKLCRQPIRPEPRPNFHQWLEPAAGGRGIRPQPGRHRRDSGWLHGHGFAVDAVANDRMSIRFSGTAEQVESAFHTEIHNLEVKGSSTSPT